uniref:C2H2-type domain-containing protein n=1 Tax=Poecilia mexicana TaxID=48701 RepID=A0A3B3Y5C6_9TELE
MSRLHLKNPPWSTPVRGVERRSTRSSEGAPGEPTRCFLLLSFLLKRRPRPPEEGPDQMPIMTIKSAPPVKRLFSLAPPRCNFLFFSTTKNWRSKMTSDLKLPPYVTVGLRMPWREQNCPLCLDAVSLSSAREGVTHLISKHKARKVEWYCLKCHSRKKSLASAPCHSGKCGSKPSKSPESKPHGCDICPASFGSQRGLSLHKKRKHLNSNPVSAQRPTCDAILNIDMEDALVNTPLYPTNKTSKRKRKGISLRKLLKRTFKDWDTPKGGLHPLNSPPKVVNKTLWKYIKNMRAIKSLKGELAVCRKNFTHSHGRQKIRSHKFKYLQWLIKQDFSAAATVVFEGMSLRSCPLNKDVVESTYRTLWEGRDKFTGLGVFGDISEADNGHLRSPVTPDEVLGILKGMKENTAPGPDGVRKSHLLKWDKDGKLLACLFNSILFNGKLPSILKGSRTTLVPKCHDEEKLRLIENWMPITLSSVILRILSKLLCNRLSDACPTHLTQRGFIKGKGCSTNLMFVDGLIKRAWRKKETLALVLVDLARAFDTVSHKHISEVLEIKSVDISVRNLIEDSYHRSYSRILTGNGVSDKITLRVGVKQGDPLSPLLFNLALDPLLSFLDRKGTGFRVKGMASNLKILEKFLSNIGLDVKIHKCSGFFLCPHQTVRYLGVDLCPTKGIVPTNLQVRLQDIIDHVNAAPLKPTQKLTLFSTYGIPWVLYPSVMSMVGSVDLGAADRLIRKEVKSWLHLKPCTTDGILYSRKKDGGLGLQKLGKVVPIAQLRRWSKLLQSKDPSCKTLAGTFLPKGDLDSRWRVAFGTDKKVKLKQKLESLEPHSIGPNWRREEFQKWISLRSQGRGLNAFRNDPISNSWLKDPGWLSESDFIVALHLRSNTVNTLTTLGRGSQTNSSCRLCHKGWEGLPHIVSS